ncbi:MarR family transcriptional regulator [Brevibacterium antiquum]|uniref:DNA-binding transcriptional regulator, MarR family n=1 Tax=Brevibacterium antiquum CNRZ 918 TaxID=1255637 RepID=A0A2H1HLN8_9MICO|nr:MarR family transcriptional regulator [Brevibacterium antiquum]SMX63781.1 DNA-binding transcriptional regulator, MarR family [Brevibacterium antiquum CNRZ 918]
MPTSYDPLALESQICFALAVASRGVISAYRSVLEPIHLTHPQYLVMLALWQHETLPVRKIAELLRLEAATVSPLIKRLEALGYVEKRRGSHDERVVEVSLTVAGAKLRGTAEAIPGQMMAKLDMGEAELRELHSMMTRLIEAVDASQAVEVSHTSHAVEASNAIDPSKTVDVESSGADST